MKTGEVPEVKNKNPIDENFSDLSLGVKTEEATVQNTYIIRPNYSQKFRPANVKELIHTILGEKLTGVTYSSEESTALTKDIADTIKLKLKELGYDRYKFIVQVVVGEQRGEGVKMSCRCFWDSDTDSYAQDIFMNESLFCVAAAFGVFKY